MAALLVEDDDQRRATYTSYLSAQNVQVTSCADGRQALAVALTQSHDLIVTAAKLNGIDGYQLCQLLRRDSATERTPILVVTADDSELTLKHAVRAGANAIVATPCQPEALLAAMRQLAEGATADRATLSPGTRSRRPLMSRTYARCRTTTPPASPPEAQCPQCARRLIYRHSHIGGVSPRHPEQWDDFECPYGCGPFEYRQRTRRLRRAR